MISRQKKMCSTHKTSREDNLGAVNARGGCFSSGHLGWAVTSPGHPRSPLSPSAAPQGIRGLLDPVEADGQLDPGVKSREWIPDVSRDFWSRHPCTSLPADSTLESWLAPSCLRLWHLPKDGLGGLGASGKTLSPGRCLGQGVPAVRSSWADWESSLSALEVLEMKQFQFKSQFSTWIEASIWISEPDPPSKLRFRIKGRI